MAKKQVSAEQEPNAARKKSDRRQVDVDKDLVRKIRVIAGLAGVTVPDYLNNRIRSLIEEDYEEVKRKVVTDEYVEEDE